VRNTGQFEDLLIWQKARALTKAVYEVTKRGEFARDFGLSQQIQRASVSIMSNIAEGFERGGRREFHQFLVVAKASCGELRSQLYIALDIDYLRKNEFDDLKSQADVLSKMLSKFQTSLKTQIQRAKTKVNNP
jgi:four helix bundle protein